MNREWTGIDRLRLDKFYMVRPLAARPSGVPRGAVVVGVGSTSCCPAEVGTGTE